MTSGGDPAAPAPATTEVELDITALAAGGDGVARDPGGKVTFVPHTAVGDRVRAAITATRTSFARGELLEVIAPSPHRIAPPCALAASHACGGCQWQHVARPAQLAAKQAIVAGALRKAIARGLELLPIRDPGPAYGWRRRARLHVAAGAVGFFAPGSHAIADQRGAGCAQLDPRLDRAVQAARAATPPDGELDVALGHTGAVVLATAAAWPAAARLIGTAGIVGVVAGETTYGEAEVELEPGLVARATDFAQAGAAGNAALVAAALAALGPARGALLELHAGGGNFTRALVGAGWQVTASDVVAPRRRIEGIRFLKGSARSTVRKLAAERFAAVLLDPPRTGAAEVVALLPALEPATIVYVSCDPATLGRDLELLAGAGAIARRAQPIDLMPQTSHVEVVVTVTPAPAG